MIHIRMRGKECFALGKREVQITNQVNDLVDIVFIADVDEQPLVLIINQVEIATDQVPGLDIQFDDIWENRFASDHVWFFRNLRSKTLKVVRVPESQGTLKNRD